MNNDNAFEVQTRSEDTGLRLFPTFAEAIEHASKDKTVWKISFNLPNGERMRLVKLNAWNGDRWEYEPQQ